MNSQNSFFPANNTTLILSISVKKRKSFLFYFIIFFILLHFSQNFMIIFCIYFSKYDSIICMERDIMRFLFVLMILIIPFSLCFGQDERSLPVEVYVIFDNSVSMQGSEDEAAAWLSRHIADNILQAGDSLTVWSASGEPAVEFSGTVGGEESISEIKAVLASITPTENAGNDTAAFENIKKIRTSPSQYAQSYIILVTGVSGSNASLFSAEAAEVLKYSRSNDFPGWKVMIIGLGIEQRVRTAAAAYMSSER